MSAASPAPVRGGPTAHARARARARINRIDTVGDAVLYGLCILALIVAAGVFADILYQVVHGASQSISRFGLGFLVSTKWEPNFFKFGAGVFLYGTFVTSAMALALAGP